MDTVFEINGVFPQQPRLCAPDLGTRLIQNPTAGRPCQRFSALGRRQQPCDLDATAVAGATKQAGETPTDRSAAWADALGFILAVLVVTGLGTLGAWAVMLIIQSLAQAQSLMVQNSFVFQR